MARNRWTLALIIVCLPILATVISAFRVRDLPRSVGDSADKFTKYSVKDSAKSYEELKKAVREKQQLINQKANAKSGSVLKIVSDSTDDDDNDDDDDFDFFNSINVDKSKVKSKSSIGEKSSESKITKHPIRDEDVQKNKAKKGKVEEITKKAEVNIRAETKRAYEKSKLSFEDNDDDDDDDDDDKTDSSFINKKPKPIELVKKENLIKDKKKEDIKYKVKSNIQVDYNDDDDDDDDDYDDDDDDDDRDFKKKAEKSIETKKKDDANQGLKKMDVINKSNPVKSKQDDKDDDDNDDDDDDDDDEDDEDNRNLKKDLKSKSSSLSQKKDAIDKLVPSTDTHSVKMDEKKVKADSKLEDKKVLSVKETKPREPKLKSAEINKLESKKEKPPPLVKKEEIKYKIELSKKEEHKEESNKDKESVIDLAKPKSTQKPEEGKKVEKKSELKKPETSKHKGFEETVETSYKKEKDDKKKSKDLDNSEPKTINIIDQLTDILYRRNMLASEFEDFYAFLPTFAPNFSRIHNPECRRHGQILLRQLRGTKLWALNMLDASAKIPSGILQGNGIQLGDFDQCLGSRARVQLETGSVVKVQGKYCLARLDVKAEHQELEVPVHLAQAKNLIRSRIDDPGHFVPRFSTLSWGVCVPSACNPEDAEVVIKDSLKHYQHTSGLAIKVKIDERDCHIHQSSWDEWFQLSTVLTLSFYAVIILLVLVATVQDYLSSGSSKELPSEDADDKAECDQEAEEEEKDKDDAPKSRVAFGDMCTTNNRRGHSCLRMDSQRIRNMSPKATKNNNSFLSSFSLYSTLKKLTAPGSNDEISCIHGIRGLATIALLIAHKFLPVAVTPYNNRLKITEVVSSPLWSWCRAGWIYTDCFLLLSGTLTAHRMSADGSGARRLFSRYLRLTPALLAVVLFYAYIWDTISTGPMWGTLVTRNAEICQEGWWWNLLYVQNWFGFEDMCAPQTHQLALDMQLTIIGGMIVWVMQVRPGVSKLLLPTIIGLAAYSRYSTVSEHRLTLLAYHGVSVSQLYRTARLSYTSVYHRCTPYLIGISLGIALQKPSQLNKVLLALGWLTSGALWSVIWWAGLDSGDTQYRYSALFAANYAALAPVAASLAIAWVIYAVHNGYCELLANFLCCRLLVFVSRLSYALYLCQFIVFLTEAGTIRTSSEFSLMSMIDLHEISLIMLSSTLLTLTFVIPMQSLHKVFTFSSNSGKDDNKEESEEKLDENHIGADAENTKDQEEEIDVPQIKTRQFLVAHREVLEEIPEADIEYEVQRDKLEGLEEILEEEEEEGADDDIRENHLDEEDLEVIEEEQGGEDDFWGDRDEDYVPRRAYPVRDDDEDIDEWEWTANGSQNGAQHYRYTR